VRRYLLPAERPAANSLHAAAAVHRRDRQTDGRTDTVLLHRPCSAYYADSTNSEKLIVVMDGFCSVQTDNWSKRSREV